ncbi:NDP-sugar synthase [Candidatus Latescibacterota bacterium]
MKGVILAAGKGTRMKDITRALPKPMIALQGRPMLEHIVTAVRDAGVTDIGLVVGYKKEIIASYFGEGTSFGVSLTYLEQTSPNGTGAAFHLAREFAAGDAVFLTFGDVMTPPENYRGIIDYFDETRCDALLGLNRVDDPYQGAAVYLDGDDNIVRMVEKPPRGTSTTSLINAGLMVFSPDIFSFTGRLSLSPRGEYELTDVFGMLREAGRSLKGYILKGYWKDVGTPEDIDHMNHKTIHNV